MYSVMGNACTDFLTFDGPVLWLTEDVLNRAALLNCDSSIEKQ